MHYYVWGLQVNDLQVDTVRDLPDLCVDSTKSRLWLSDLTESDDIQDYHGVFHGAPGDDVSLDGCTVGHGFVGVDASRQLLTLE